MAFDFDVVVYPISNPKSKVVAFANLIVDSQVEICGFKIINGANGLFVAPPNSKSNKTNDDGTPVYYDDVRFLGDKEEGKFRTDLQDQIYKLMIERYNEKATSTARGAAAAAHPVTTESRTNPMATGKLW